MNRLAFIFSGIIFLLGLLSLLVTLMIKATVPVLGYMAFQIAAKGSFDPKNYQVSFGEIHFICIALIIFGLIFMFVFFKKKIQ